MRVHADLSPLPAEARGASVALGALDGLHLGHMAVIAAAKAAGGPLGVAAFEPSPRRYFQPDAPPFRLMTRALRRETLAARGDVALLAELPFDATMAALSPEDFCRVVLGEALGVGHVAIGFDFRFGRDRAGDGAALRRAGARLGFGVTVVDPVLCPAGVKISSTRVRAALTAGDVAGATTLLGRPWRVEGVVAHGDARGRTIGFPTANLRLGDQLHPRFGVYAVTVDIGDGVARPGVANVGRTPTVGARDPLLEAHLFDVDRDLYGRRLVVALHAFLRPEQAFSGIEALKAQIAADAAEARRRLAA